MTKKHIISLDSENISIGGSIERIKCSNCQYESFRLILQSDTDMVYMDVVGLTDIKNNRLLITHITRSEYNDWKNQIPKGLEQRINKIFNSDSFIYFDQKHFNDKMTDRPIFRPICPNCSDYLTKVKQESFDEFINKGGKIITMSIHSKE